MAFRSGCVLHLQSSTVPQPMFGSWITAGIGAPSSLPITITLGTAAAGSGAQDSNGLFAAGDEVWLIDPSGANFEKARIQSVQNNNTVTLGPQTTVPPNFDQNQVTLNPHVSGIYGTGTFIALSLMVNNISITFEDGGGSTFMYIGNTWNFTPTYRRVAKLAKVSTGVQPYTWSASELTGGNPCQVSELWVMGGAGNSLDGYNPVLMID